MSTKTDRRDRERERERSKKSEERHFEKERGRAERSPDRKRSRKEREREETPQDSRDLDDRRDRKRDRRRSEDREKSKSLEPERAEKLDRDRERSKKSDERRARDERERGRESPDRKRSRKDNEKGEMRHQEEGQREVKRELENGLNNDNMDQEEGELKEAEIKKEPTKRDLEIERLKQELMAKEDEQAEEPVWCLRKAQSEKASRQCPYLDTIDRGVLDFDFEKLCSVSLSHINVYACMICGKYFQGRGTNTHAYTHALDTDHHVYLNLATLKFYCLPDNYEIIDPSLEDIQYYLKPTYTVDHVKQIDKNTKMARAYDGTTYYPGIVGLNNIKANDYANVIFHALSHVPPLRNYFLREENYVNVKRPPGDKLNMLPQRFGELVRKLWNPRAFKAHVSPHEMLQACVITSDKKFQILQQSDANDFISFLLNTLHLALNGTQKTTSSIVYKTFRGRIRQYTRKVLPVDATDEARRTLMETDEFSEKVEEKPFLFLAMDLPPAPLYRDERLQNIIPQVPLNVLMNKFNGETEKEYKTYKDNFVKKFVLTRLPEYLIITYNRFQKNQWFVEKNPTIVNFPISNVDFYDCLAEDARELHKFTTYDLVSNVIHDGLPENGTYRIQLIHNGTGKWFELEDLHVKEILPQMITLAESYIQIWRLNRKKTREERLGEVAPEDQ